MKVKKTVESPPLAGGIMSNFRLKEAPNANLPPAYGYDVYPRCPPGVAQMKVHRVLYPIPRFKI